MSVAATQALFEKAAKLFGLPGGGRAGVAVSGGADSMALCFLTRDFMKKNGGEMVALIVDHGLRPSSAAEAELTARRLETAGISTRILKWTDDKPQTGIEHAAREARYALLAGACRLEGCSSLLLGHNRQDQAETYLIRLAHKSGPAGLAGMSAVRETDFGRILRPLLGISPADLREYNRTLGIQWVEDETNYGTDFERSRLRAGLTPEKIEDAFQKSLTYGRGRLRLEEETAAFVRSAAQASEMGYVLFSSQAFKELPFETARFFLGNVLCCVADRAYAPRFDSLDRLVLQIQAENFKGATLGGCRVAPCAKKRVLVWREAADLPPAVTVRGCTDFHWDRFSFSLEKPLDFAVTVRPLGNALKVENAFPKRAFFVLPALFDDEGLFIVPHLGYKRTGTDCQVMFAPQTPLRRKAQWTCPVVF